MLSRPTAAVIRRLSETGFEDRHFECLPRSDNVAELSRFGGQLAHHYPEPALREQPASRAVVGSFDDALCGLRTLLVALPAVASKSRNTLSRPKRLLSQRLPRGPSICAACAVNRSGSRHGHVGFRLLQCLDDRRGDVFGLHRLDRSAALGARDQFGVGERRHHHRDVDAVRRDLVGQAPRTTPPRRTWRPRRRPDPAPGSGPTTTRC